MILHESFQWNENLFNDQYKANFLVIMIHENLCWPDETFYFPGTSFRPPWIYMSLAESLFIIRKYGDGDWNCCFPYFLSTTLIAYNLFKHQETNTKLVSKIIQTMIELSCMKITRWQNILTPEVQRKESNKAKNSSNKIYVVSSKDSLHFK